MTAGYVAEQGAVVKLRGKRLLVTSGGELIEELRFHELQVLVVIGNITLTTPALSGLLDNGVAVAFLSLGGKFRGRLEPPSGTTVETRRVQFLAAEEAGLCLDLAKRALNAKLMNCRAVLLRGARNGAGRAPSRLRTIAETLWDAPAIEEARVFEGAASAAYFADLGALFKEPWEFRERNRRPPKDPVNALLSLGYTLLLTRCIAALQVAGLDVDVGFLHTSHHGSPALALDMMEEFRPTIVDTLVLRVLNGGVLTPKDFTSDDRLPCKLTGEAFKTYVGEFERRLATEFTPEGRVTATTYAEFIRDQAMAIRRSFEQRDPDLYQPHIRR